MDILLFVLGLAVLIGFWIYKKGKTETIECECGNLFTVSKDSPMQDRCPACIEKHVR